jgi:hypothetical protein
MATDIVPAVIWSPCKRFTLQPLRTDRTTASKRTPWITRTRMVWAYRLVATATGTAIDTFWSVRDGRSAMKAEIAKLGVE